MADLKEIIQAIVSYGIHLSFIREMVKMWTSSKKATLQDWTQLISAVLESVLQLLWQCYWREEAKFLE